jgi:hypothetical protein
MTLPKVVNVKPSTITVGGFFYSLKLTNMDGGCISIWVEKQLTLNERLLLQKYEYFLMDYGLGYSFSYEFRQPIIDTRFERKQIQSHLGFIPQQEIQICGLADPMFRAAEAIMKYFNGYYKMAHDDDISQAKGKHYRIKKRNRFGIPVYNYHLVNWEYIGSYFNVLDSDKIRNVYSFERFKRNEFQGL